MKKLLALILAFMLVFSLTACSSRSNKTILDEANSSNTLENENTNETQKEDSTNITPEPVVTPLTDSKIYVDLVEVETDTPPQLVDGVTMVPIKPIMELIGYDVTWIAEEKRLEVWESSKQHATIIVTAGNTAAYYEKHDKELEECVSYEAVLEAAPVVVNETLCVPLTFLADAIEYTVDSYVDTEHIYIFSPEYMENQSTEGKGVNQTTTEESKKQATTESSSSGEGIGEPQQMTNDNEDGEGIGQSTVSEDEKSYVLGIRTESWLELSQEQKEEVIFIIGRWWDAVDGYVVENFDSMLADLDHQMETYHRNGVDEGILQTACDIYGMDVSKYIN